MGPEAEVLAETLRAVRASNLTRAMGVVVSVALLSTTSSCSIKKMATNSVANSLTSGPDVFGRDDDPELIRDALPFGLKTMESLLETLPKHRGLLLTLCKGFTQYGVAFIQFDADEVEGTDYTRATELRDRARRMFLRARGYGLRGLELDHKDLGSRLRQDPDGAAKKIEREQQEMLYWTAAAWGSAVNLGKDDPQLLGDLGIVRALMQRGLELDERWDGGAFHEAMIILESMPEAMGGSPARARRHYDRAVELSGGTKASPYVTLAQTLSVQTQNRAEFEQLLERALAVDPNRDPAQRLANLVLQRRAKLLLAHADDLFVDSADSLAAPPEESK